MVVNNSVVQATNSVTIGNSSPSSSLIVSNGGSLIVTNGGTASVVVNGGSLILGTGTFKTDNLIVTNGGVVQQLQTYQVNNGSITVSSGSVQMGSNLVAGSSANSTGIVTVTGGSLVVTNGVVGIGNNGTKTNGTGVGQMTVSNATVLASTIVLGSSAGGQGTLLVGAGGVVQAPAGCTNCALIANDITITDGAEVDNYDLMDGYGWNGEVTVTGGSTATFKNSYIGYDNPGTLTMSASTLQSTGTVYVGYDSGVPGSVWVSGGNVAFTNGVTYVADSGSGQMTVSNGATVQTSTLTVGNQGGSQGTLTVAGGTLSTITNVSMSIGSAASSLGTVWLSGGTLAPDGLSVGNAGVGQLTMSGGTLNVGSLGMTVGSLASSQGTFTMSGGTAMATSMIVGTFGCTVTNGVVQVINGNLYVTNAAHTAVLEVRNGVVVLSNGFVEIDWLVLTNACGRFVHAGGTLLLNNAPVLGASFSAVGDGIPNSWKQHYGLDPFDPNLANKDGDGTGMSNSNKFMAGISPINPAAYLHVTSIVRAGNDINVSYLGADGDSTWSPGIAKRTNILEFTTGTANGSYMNVFLPVPAALATNILSGGTGVGLATNMVDSWGATNVPARYYRVRVLAP
jgi:T5SS/PEP-CTERM-associated repeat protein